ncbi:lipid-A-disaccharide synthase [Plectonema cf. radiosum LEGE 06105]|uniref:Lipid-A-disaccharide synthase n=1 Tax=Plectonema cf. radiosum LEGE 06105 TaxID=945769 RepID=A0A8J7K1Z5_9CYAN|nr:lipid-A-disaccharide synthase [Plectonema radiosum]MBE9212502.1 lipid-A-disaccharide synthase [Plectonema cf. radiosum LEGE 06105]
MRIFISTGEVSGDLQGSLLITALKHQAAAMGLELEIVALGGDKMAHKGASLIGNTTSIGSIGILESLPFVLPTLKIQRQAIAFLQEYPPDLVVFIDYAGPNMAIGKYIRRHMPSCPTVYYIAPQVWVTSITERDTEQIINISNKILAIFPEEARYFQKKGADVTWVGHPLVDRMQTFPNREAARAKLGIDDNVTCVALLPASRIQEIKFIVPVMFEAAREIQSKIPNVHFWIPLSMERYRQQIEKEIINYQLKATVISTQQQEVLAAADLAITKSGTVNLELGLLNIPQVVLYRLNPFTFWVAKNILKIKFSYASPANLLVMREIVPEFIQERATPENIVQAAMELLLNQQRQQQMQADYQQMQQFVGEVGVCDRAAKEILKLVNS